jgi:4-hydroxybenzoate polyprenyltransferase
MASVSPKEIARLLRVEYLGFSCVCVIGALAAAGRDLRLFDGLVLFLIHMFSIAWGFVHNDLCDVGHDRGSAVLRERPLVKGSVSRRQAGLLIGLCLLGAFGLAALIYGRPLPLAILLLSAPPAAIYNRVSKRMAGADLLFAASATLLCLFGAAAVSPGVDSPLRFPPLVWTVAAVEFVDHLFFNIAGSLKDLIIDRRSGARSTPIALGVTVGEDRAMIVPPRFKALLMSLKTLTVGLVFLPVLTAQVPVHPLQVPFLAAAALLALRRTWNLLSIEVFDRTRVARRIVRQENACKAMVPLMLVAHTGIGWMLFFLIAPAWFLFFNALINGHPFQPPKTY